MLMRKIHAFQHGDEAWIGTNRVETWIGGLGGNCTAFVDLLVQPAKCFS